MKAATLWYHDHAMGLERLNQCAGLFGLFTIRDDVEDALRLPSGAYEGACSMICDRLVRREQPARVSDLGRPKGALEIPELNGDAILINRKAISVSHSRAARVSIPDRRFFQHAFTISPERWPRCSTRSRRPGSLFTRQCNSPRRDGRTRGDGPTS